MEKDSVSQACCFSVMAGTRLAMTTGRRSFSRRNLILVAMGLGLAMTQNQ
jgi:hypothetical protein